MGVPQPQQQLAATLARSAVHHREQLDGRPVVQRCLLVGEQRRRPIARPDKVLERLSRLAERRRQVQVAGDLGQMRIQVGGVYSLQKPAHLPVQLHPSCRRQVLVERLAHQLMRERAAARYRQQLADHAHRGGLSEHLQQPRRR